MVKKCLYFLLPSLLSGCSTEPPAAGSTAAGGAAGKEAAPQRAMVASHNAQTGDSPRLATVKPSREGDAAALQGTLEVAGRCIYVNVAGSRTLIVSAVSDARWDAAEGVLRVGNDRLRPGAPVFLGGSYASTSSLSGTWVESPPQGCAMPRVWVASTIRGN
jgi:hypothetical protein